MTNWQDRIATDPEPAHPIRDALAVLAGVAFIFGTAYIGALLQFIFE